MKHYLKDILLPSPVGEGLGVRLLLFVAMLSTLQLSAHSAASADSVPDGIFFRISGGGLAEPSYILGSLHTIPGTFVHCIPGFDEAAGSVRQFIFERDVAHDLRQIGAQLTDSIMEKKIMERNDSLFRYEDADSLHNPYAEDMDSATYKLVCRTMAEEFDMPDFYLRSVLRNIPLIRQQYFAAVRRLVSEAGKPLGAVECPLDIYVADSVARPRGALIARLDTAWVIHAPDSTYAKFLADEAAGLNDRKFYTTKYFVSNVFYYWILLNTTRRYCASYFRYEGRAMLEPMQNELEQKIFVERNALWMERLPALLRQNPSLVVVGFGHLFDRADAPGLLTSLMRLGYAVEAIAAPKSSE
ncbi:MAG: TraB/GumN family protein [Alloprevotella sp.]|nr:TraB/GumN family protein [Alloprevotella sp.]